MAKQLELAFMADNETEILDAKSSEQLASIKPVSKQPSAKRTLSGDKVMKKAAARGKPKRTPGKKPLGKRTARPYPSVSFRDATQVGDAIWSFAAGDKIRRLTLFEKFEDVADQQCVKDADHELRKVRNHDRVVHRRMDRFDGSWQASV
jgi:hypothetical protein